MLGDLANSLSKTKANALDKNGATALSSRKAYHPYTNLRKDEGLLEGGDEELVRLETAISYKPRTDQPKYVKQGGFVVKPRICPKDIRCRYASWEDYAEHADEDATQRLVKKWTYIGPEWFELAKANAGVTLEIGVDYVRYNEHLKGKWREKYGEEPPPDVRLLSLEIDGEASMCDYAGKRQEIYEGSIQRHIEQDKERRKNKKK